MQKIVQNTKKVFFLLLFFSGGEEKRRRKRRKIFREEKKLFGRDNKNRERKGEEYGAGRVGGNQRLFKRSSRT